MKAHLGLLAVALFLLSGCVTRLTDFTILSTKNIDLSRMAEYQKDPERVRGEDMKHLILGIPVGMPNMKEAIDRAIEQKPGGVALTDGVIEHYGWSAIFYGQVKYIAEGTVLKEPQGSSD